MKTIEHFVVKSFTSIMFDITFDRKIFGISSEIFGSLRESSENFRKCSESFVCPSDNTLKNFNRRSEFIGKSSSCFLLKLTAHQVTFYRCIAGSIFFHISRRVRDVFGNLRKILENVQKVSYALRTTL